MSIHIHSMKMPDDHPWHHIKAVSEDGRTACILVGYNGVSLRHMTPLQAEEALSTLKFVTQKAWEFESTAQALGAQVDPATAPELLAALKAMIAPYENLSDAELFRRYGHPTSERIIAARGAVSRAAPLDGAQ